MVRAVFDPMPQDVDYTALRYLSLEPRQELPTSRAVIAEVEGGCDFFLRGGQEGTQLREIKGILSVVLVRIARNPASVRHARDDQGFERLLAGVGSHVPA